MSAVRIHVAKITGRATDPRLLYVEVDGNIPNTTGGPTVDAYIALEAADGFIPIPAISICPQYANQRVATLHAGDLNSATS